MGAAIMLARRGREVVLCEAQKRIAPLLRGFSRQGHHFDTGFHCAGALGPSGALSRYLRMVGVLKHLRLVPMRPDCIELYRFMSGSAMDFCLPQDANAVAEAFALVWPEHKEQVRLFFADMKDKFNHSAFTNPDKVGFDFSTMQGGRSLRGYLDAMGLPERLKSILASHCVFMGTAPQELSLDEFALVSHAMFEDLHTIAGGGKALVDAFETELASCGVKVITGRAVRNILTENGRVSGVRFADGEELACEACVYTGHPSHLPDMLPEGALRPSMASHLRALRDTERSFTIYGTTSSNFAANRFVYLCATDFIQDIFHAPFGDKTWITLSANEPDSDGKYAVVATMGLPGGIDGSNDLPPALKSAKRHPDYAARKAECESWALERLKAYAPELGDFELVCSSTDYTMRDWVHGGTGSIYGVLHSLTQIPVLPRTRVENLVLAGQGIVLPGLLGVLVSAAVAAGLLIGFDDIFEDFRNGKA